MPGSKAEPDGTAARGLEDGGAGGIAVSGVSKRYRGVQALHPIDLNVPPGSTTAVVGPSGAGKSTLLRILAGLERADTGHGTVAGWPLGSRAAIRNMGFVFQNYALFPHLTVAGNVAFPLRRRRLPRAEIDARVTRMLASVRLDGKAHRLPHELSGGEQQRAALARALVYEPAVLFLDEPFAALDLDLARHLQEDVLALTEEHRPTVVLVTHDPTYAVAAADVVVLLHAGRCEQVGPPGQVWSRPRTEFAARFLGPVSVLAGQVGDRVPAGAEVVVQLAPGQEARAVAVDDLPAGPVSVLVRPSDVAVVPAGDAAGPAGHGGLSGRLVRCQFRGSYVEGEVRLAGGQRCLAEWPTARPPQAQPGDEVSVCWSPSAATVVARA